MMNKFLDDYRTIEVVTAERFGATAKGTKKSIGDFLLANNTKKPVNVKSNNVDKNNYSPNIISAKRLIKWLEDENNELYFIFVDYKKSANGVQILKESGLIPVEWLSWDCLTIEAQGWGVIQMCKDLQIDSSQDRKGFLQGLKKAYEKYIDKQTVKMEKIREMIEPFKQ